MEVFSDNSRIGEKKKAGLGNFSIYTFRSHGQLVLLGYTHEDKVRLIYREAVAPHENFYRDFGR